MGMTILPRSSMCLIIPVFVAPLRNGLSPGALSSFDPNVFLPFVCGGLHETSPRFAISNHHSRLRGRAESFV